MEKCLRNLMFNYSINKKKEILGKRSKNFYHEMLKNYFNTNI